MRTRMMVVAVVMALVLGLAGTAGAGPVQIADSQTEFSGTQGLNNWYYYYWAKSGSYNPANVVSMLYYAPASEWTEHGGAAGSNGPWTRHRSTWGQPGTASGTLHSLVRRWVGEVNATVNIYGNFQLQGTGSGYDGVDVYVFVDGVSKWSQTLTTTTQVNYSINVPISVGAKVDFVIDPKGNDRFDGTNMRARIQYEPPVLPVPEPASLGLLGLALVGLRKRRK